MGPESTFVFGKRKPFEEGLVREYERLHIGPKLSKDSLDALRHLCDSFSWRGGAGPAIWEPVAATIVFNNPHRILICRILDDGSDNLGRPHLVRVEAVEINLEQAGERDAVGQLLDPRTWSVEGPMFQVQRNATNKLVPCDTNLKLPAKSGTWSITGDSSRYMFQGEWDKNKHPQTPESSYSSRNNTLDITGTNPGSQAVSRYDEASNRTNALPGRGNNPARGAIPWVLCLCVLSLIGMGALAYYYYEQFQKESNVHRETKRKGEITEKELKDVKEKKSKLESDKAELDRHIQVLSPLKEENLKLDKRLITTNTMLSEAKKDLDRAISGNFKELLRERDKKIDDYKTENKKCTETINKLKVENKEFTKILDSVRNVMKEYNNTNQKSPLEGKATTGKPR